MNYFSTCYRSMTPESGNTQNEHIADVSNNMETNAPESVEARMLHAREKALVPLNAVLKDVPVDQRNQAIATLDNRVRERIPGGPALYLKEQLAKDPGVQTKVDALLKALTTFA